jgi:hypothetical protein
MIFASLGKSKSWNGVSHFFDARSDKVRFQLKIKVFYRCVPGYLFFGAFRETGPALRAVLLYGQSPCAFSVFVRLFMGKSFQKSGFFRQRDRFLGQFVPRKNS